MGNRWSSILIPAAAAALAGAVALDAQTPTPAPAAAKKRPAPAWSSPDEGGSRYGGEVLEISPEVLDRFAAGLAAEETARKAIAAKSAAIKSQADYDQCKSNVMMTPEGMKLLEDYNTAVNAHPNDFAAMQKAATAMKLKMDAMTEKACGPDPAAASVSLPNLLRDAETAAAKGQGFTPRQFAILKERVLPLCLSDPTPPGAKGVKLPGQGNASFVYTAAEAEALRPRCESFLKALKPPAN
ncbi:MAG TPA: hypothetical protein VLW17_12045 [Thermoanaerobaculaceae bacterium]|nr:hypothetical protein [Thermoanaerobaculaceae bacterium]